MEIIEQSNQWRDRYKSWCSRRASDDLKNYPFVENQRAPFTPARRALPLMNLALISSAGAYIDGTDSFDIKSADGDMSVREIPTEIRARDLKFAARGYDDRFVREDMNSQLPLTRLLELEANRVIGQLNSVFWSFCGFIPEAATFAETALPKLVDRLNYYGVQGALLIPASELCHQSMGLAARAIEQAGIPTVITSVSRVAMERVRPPRAGYYRGEFGCVAGKPNFPEYQRRVIEEAMRWLEPMSEPGIRKLGVELESQVEAARGER
ncbi:MAG TPA: glycine/sarcosine/betaine reductase selenoprotein B family protein [Pyrinomonadaceae bacterium]|nr:glycine/sarcosine/betaine reductase selenoprotein B family protein [Pyrinomonadaceae bacterium]